MNKVSSDHCIVYNIIHKPAHIISLDGFHVKCMHASQMFESGLGQPKIAIN